MGWAVKAKFDPALDGQPLEDQNPNTLEMIADFLRDVDRIVAWTDDEMLRAGVGELAERIETYLAGERMAS